MLEICSQINGGSNMIERALQQTIHEFLDLANKVNEPLTGRKWEYSYTSRFGK